MIKLAEAKLIGRDVLNMPVQELRNERHDLSKRLNAF
jgi:hypothetical protein